MRLGEIQRWSLPGGCWGFDQRRGQNFRAARPPRQ